MSNKGDLIKKVTKFAGKFQNNLVVSSITQGMMSTMGVLMGSAILNIVINLPIPAWNGFLANIGILTPLNEVVQIANCVGLFMSFGIGRTIAQKMGAENPIEAGIISLFCFLIVTPLIGVAGGWGMNYSVDLANFGAQGVITCMLVALSAGALYTKMSQTKLKIKMPDSVPPFVAQSFENLPGFMVTIIPFVIIRILFGATTYGCFTTFINSTIQGPLVAVGNSFGGHLVLIAMCSLLWWLGMHGTLIVYPALMILTYAPLTENIAAIAAGQAAPNLLSFMTLMAVFQMFGGPGCLFGLYVDMAFFTKSERYKAQGKLQLVPGMFNIIEPAVYGMPIVLNFILLIPFVVFPLVVYGLMYLCLNLGLFTSPITMASSFLPGPILGFLASGGFGFGLFVIAMCLLSCVVYFPFVKIMDAQALEEEKA